MTSKHNLLTNLHQKKQPWNPEVISAVTSPFGVEHDQLKDAETDLELRLAVIKAQQESLIQQTNAAIKIFNSAPKIDSVASKDEEVFEVQEDPNIVEKYNNFQTRVLQGSDLKHLCNTISLKLAEPPQPINNSALGVLFKKKATCTFLELDDILFPKQSVSNEVINVQNLMEKVLPFNPSQLENLPALIPSSSDLPVAAHNQPLEEQDFNPEEIPAAEEYPITEEEEAVNEETEEIPAAPMVEEVPKKKKNRKEAETFDFRTILELPAHQDLKPPKYKKKERKFALQFQPQEKPKNIVEKWLEQKEAFSFDRFLSLNDCKHGFFKQFNGSIAHYKNFLAPQDEQFPNVPEEINNSMEENDWIAVEDNTESSKRRKISPATRVPENISIEAMATTISEKLDVENLPDLIKELEGEAPRSILFASVIMAINGKEIEFPKMSSNPPSSNHMQSLIQNIMRKFQTPSQTSIPATTPSPVLPRPILSAPANYSTAPSAAKPKIAATFLHFYSGPNSTSTSLERTASLDLPIHSNYVQEAESPKVLEEGPSSNNFKEPDQLTARPTFYFNVPASVPSNPFKRPQPALVEHHEAPSLLPPPVVDTSAVHDIPGNNANVIETNAEEIAPTTSSTEISAEANVPMETDCTADANHPSTEQTAVLEANETTGMEVVSVQQAPPTIPAEEPSQPIELAITLKTDKDVEDSTISTATIASEEDLNTGLLEVQMPTLPSMESVAQSLDSAIEFVAPSTSSEELTTAVIQPMDEEIPQAVVMPQQNVAPSTSSEEQSMAAQPPVNEADLHAVVMPQQTVSPSTSCEEQSMATTLVNTEIHHDLVVPQQATDVNLKPFIQPVPLEEINFPTEVLDTAVTTPHSDIVMSNIDTQEHACIVEKADDGNVKLLEKEPGTSSLQGNFEQSALPENQRDAAGTPVLEPTTDTSEVTILHEHQCSAEPSTLRHQDEEMEESGTLGERKHEQATELPAEYKECLGEALTIQCSTSCSTADSILLTDQIEMVPSNSNQPEITTKELPEQLVELTLEPLGTAADVKETSDEPEVKPGETMVEAHDKAGQAKLLQQWNTEELEHLQISQVLVQDASSAHDQADPENIPLQCNSAELEHPQVPQHASSAHNEPGHELQSAVEAIEPEPSIVPTFSMSGENFICEKVDIPGEEEHVAPLIMPISQSHEESRAEYHQVPERVEEDYAATVENILAQEDTLEHIDIFNPEELTPLQVFVYALEGIPLKFHVSPAVAPTRKRKRAVNLHSKAGK